MIYDWIVKLALLLLAPLELHHQKQVSDPVVGIRRLIIGIGIVHSRSVVEIHRQSFAVSHLEKNCNKSWVASLFAQCYRSRYRNRVHWLALAMSGKEALGNVLNNVGPSVTKHCGPTKLDIV